jgi:anti-sigma regulatory factor (Ser/Thr protein kinase)
VVAVRADPGADADRLTAPPRQGTAEADEVSGRGLFLVNALATSWGWQVTDAGKDVWFELRT